MTDQTLTDRVLAAKSKRESTTRLLRQLSAPEWCVFYFTAEKGSIPAHVQLSPSERVIVKVFESRLRSLKNFIGSLKSCYNLTIEQHDEMMLNQGGMCAICDCEAKLMIDHDHKTGKVRQLLCRSCNALLGRFKDSAERATEAATRATKAAEYLKKHKTP